MVIDIMIAAKIKSILPGIQLGCINAEVNVRPSTRELLDYMDRIVKEVKAGLDIDQVSRIKVIAETKDAYRKLGKDPSRYRPSAEALTRRIVQGKGLYRVNNIVDALNVISVKHGFSIGGYDRDRIDWPVELGIGLTGELYTAIGRGELNIEHMPVLRDASGAFGSPTSDSQRTMVQNKTHAFMMVFFDFLPSGEMDNVMKDAVDILREFCGARKIERIRYT